MAIMYGTLRNPFINIYDPLKILQQKIQWHLFKVPQWIPQLLCMIP